MDGRGEGESGEDEEGRGKGTGERGESVRACLCESENRATRMERKNNVQKQRDAARNNSEAAPCWNLCGE